MIVHWQRRWLRRAIIVSAAFGLLAATIAVVVAAYGFGDFGDDRRAIFTAMFGAFAVLLLWAAATYATELIRSDWVVCLDDAGLLDRRLSRVPLPWHDIGGLVPVQHGMQLMLALGVADPRSVPMPRNPLWRINRLAARMLGNPELSVRITGLDIDLFAMMHAIDDRRAAVGGCERHPLEQWDVVRAADDCEDAQYRGRTGHVLSTGGNAAERTICVMFDGADRMAILKEGDLSSLGRKDDMARHVHEEWVRSGRSITVQVDPVTGHGRLKD